MELEPVLVDDRVRALLRANDLPIDDLADEGVCLYGALDGPRLAGVIGLQVLDHVGLLRSLSVESTYRDRGLGARLCDRVMAEARARGLASLWLLTTTARDYFARRGFEVMARDEVAHKIRATAQFRSLCPATATVMRLDLVDPRRDQLGRWTRSSR